MEVPIIAYDGSDLTAPDWDVVIGLPHESEYGQKVYIECPFQARDPLKDLGWDQTHRRWDEEAEMWEIDIDSLGTATLRLTQADFSLAVTEAAARAYQEERDAES